MNDLQELGLLLSLQDKREARNKAEQVIERFERLDKSGELEQIIEELRQDVMALLEKEKEILDLLTK